MKRDMELIRLILITLEDSQQTQGVIPLTIEGYSDVQVSYHIKILAQNGIVEATDCSTQHGLAWNARGLTWDGHDYIEAVRDEGRWQKAKNWVTNAGKVLTMETLKEAVRELFF